MRLLPTSLLLAALTACSSDSVFSPEVETVLEAVLDASGSVELLALHPYPHLPEGQPRSAADDFHGYRVLDRATLEGRAQRKELIELVKRGIRASDGTVAACFNPRHGLRFTDEGDEVDFVICYECLSLQVHGPGSARASHLTASRVQRGIDRIFGGAGLEIHQKGE